MTERLNLLPSLFSQTCELWSRDQISQRRRRQKARISSRLVFLVSVVAGVTISDPYWEGGVDVAHCSESSPGHGLMLLDEMKTREEGLKKKKREISVIFLNVCLASWERRGLLEGVMSSQESLMIHVSALCSTYRTAASPDLCVHLRCLRQCCYLQFRGLC